MRMDLVQTKMYKDEIKYFKIIVGGFAILLGLIPVGYFILLPGLLYLCTREDQSHYVAMLCFVLGSLFYGGLFSLFMLAMVLLWNACAQIANFSLRNQMTWIILVSALISFVIGWITKLPLPYTMFMIVLQWIGFEIMRKDFYKDKETLYYYGIMILLLTMVVVLKRYIVDSIGLAMISGLLLYLSMIFSTKKTLYLIMITCFCYLDADVWNVQISNVSDSNLTLTVLIIRTMVPLLAVILLPKKKFQRWIAYIILNLAIFMFTKQTLTLLYFGLASFFLLFQKDEELDILTTENSFGLNYLNPSKIAIRQTNTLLHRFSLIFQELAKRNPQLQMLESVSMAFSLCEEELQATYFKEQDIKKRVEEVLKSYSFPLNRVTVEKHEVILIHLWINKLHPSELDATIVPLITNALSIPVHVVDYQKAGFFDSYHRIVLSSEKGFSLLYDQIQKPVDQECGDAILVKTWHEQMHFMMSDGMGSGKHARTQSMFVLGVLEQFMEANVPMKTAIKLVNQLAMLQNEERYATLDILSINRFKKEAMLYKSGSMQTYLLRGNQVYSFFSSSLPLGIIERINPEYYSILLKKSDLILMVSDGADHEKMKDWFKDSAKLHPSKVLRYLYTKRLEEQVDDDVSMLLVRVDNDTND